MRPVLVLGGRRVPLGRSRTYEGRWIENLHIYPAVDLGWQGPLALDYRKLAALHGRSVEAGGGRRRFRPQTIRFGRGLNEAQVRQVWLEIERRFPSLVRSVDN